MAVILDTDDYADLHDPGQDIATIGVRVCSELSSPESRGGLALNLAMLLTFPATGFAWNGDGILLMSSIQSHELIAVWTTLEPLPFVARELSFLAALAIAEAVVIAAIIERGSAT